MSAPNACTLQAIRQEAGLQHLKKLDVLAGVADGTNKVFVAPRTYVVDRNHDDVLTGADVVLYDDGVPVAIDSVVAESGAITALVAPAASSIMRADYAYCVMNNEDVTQYRLEGTDWLKSKVRSYVDYDAYTSETYPPMFSTIVRLYTAGLILIRDYGSSADTEKTSKDGYEKIKLAEKLLATWISDTEDDSETATPTTGAMRTDGNVFARNTDLDGQAMSPTPDTDEFFHHDN